MQMDPRRSLSIRPGNVTSRGTNNNNVLDRPITRNKTEVSLSAFSYLFSECIQYSQSQIKNRMNSTVELEERLRNLGASVGLRQLELCMWRSKNPKREIRLINVLQFITETVWKNLFGKTADGLERSTKNEDEYHIIDFDPLVNKYISVPKHMSQSFDCSSFVAGIIAGVLGGAEFPARVTAHATPPEKGVPNPKTTFLIKFRPEVIQREKRLDSR